MSRRDSVQAGHAIRRRDVLVRAAEDVEHASARTVDAFAKSENARRREEDLAALDSLLGCDALGERERAAFDGMRYFLTTAHPAPTLSARQRKWVFGRAEQLSLEIDDPTVRNRNVPRGREVPVPAVLQRLPLKPPQKRKVTDQ